MTEHDRLEREIHQLTQAIAADAFALNSRSTPAADRAGLQRQIGIRSTRPAGLLNRLRAASTQQTPNRKGRVRKPTPVHHARLTKGALPATRAALLARIKAIRQARATARANARAKGGAKPGVPRP